MGVISALVGALLIMTALRDIFHELFNPGASSRLSHAITRGVWAGCRRTTRRGRAILVAGPLSLILIILSWVALLILGWALVIWPQLPEGFSLASGLDPRRNESFIDALYLSTTTLTTLGYGDIAPGSEWLRILLPFEALLGFVLLTASITWVLSVYPVVNRRRALARSISLIRRAHGERFGQEEVDAHTLEYLALELIRVEGDLRRFPVTYFFYERDERMGLAAVLPELLQLLEHCAETRLRSVQGRAHILRSALEDFCQALVDVRFGRRLSNSDLEGVLGAYARDHCCLEERVSGL